MKKILITCCLIFLTGISQSLFSQGNNDSVQLFTANGHPMQYYVSLPEGWTNTRTWPVLLVIESADKEYRENALRFTRGRKKMPFIIVAPYNVNNSRSGRRDPKVFPYSSQTWDYIEQVGDCRFNLEGIAQILKDVQSKFNGEDKVYLTGFEAGAHTVWQLTFQHPEWLKASVAVAGNYNQNSCTGDPSLFSNDLSRVLLPVRGFTEEKDTLFGPATRVYQQWLNALKDAQQHGYKNISEVKLANKGHEPAPVEVLDFFYGVLTEEKKE
jgi:poly(3-hydroxybutyrate) depolymerase